MHFHKTLVHLRVIAQPVVDVLLVIVELLFARCYGRGPTREYRVKMGVLKELVNLSQNFR